MPRKINAKLVVSLLDSGNSVNSIARLYHVSKHSVIDVRDRAAKCGLPTLDLLSKSEEEVYQLLFPDRFVDADIFAPVDYEYVHKELLKPAVTLKLLWQEYKAKIPAGKIPVSYSKFCEDYSLFVGVHNYTSHILHKPGDRIETDWSGSKMHYIDPYTGESVPVYLFVATLPYSQYTFVEPTLDMKMNTWITCNVHMLEFIGGITRRIVCDNLKTGVVSHPKEGDIILTNTYEAFGDYYVTAIMPAAVRVPKQKASVEGAVGKIGTAIIASLRNVEFMSFPELEEQVAIKRDAFNSAPFQKREHSRKEVFEQEEKQYLRPLPAQQFEIFEWVYGRKVMNDCHIAYMNNRYSVPHQYAGKYVDLKITKHTMEICYKGLRLTTHQLFPATVKNKYSTHPEDMPDALLRQEWDDRRIKKWAASIGPNTSATIDRIFERVKIKEQGYNPSLSVLKLAKKYGDDRLENACRIALDHYRSPRYKHLKGILANNQDKQSEENNDKESEKSTFTRGAEYYGGKRK